MSWKIVIRKQKVIRKLKNKISQNLIKLFKSKFKFKQLYLHEPDINVGDANYLKNCIVNNSVSSVGKFVEKFENKISKLTKAKYVIATNFAPLQILMKTCRI